MNKITEFQGILGSPFVYVLIVPFVFLHIWVEFYHRLLFPVYRLEYIHYRDYFFWKRDKKLTGLAWFNCLYCSYINNLIDYVQAISKRSERFFCLHDYRNKYNYQADKIISQTIALDKKNKQE